MQKKQNNTYPSKSLFQPRKRTEKIIQPLEILSTQRTDGVLRVVTGNANDQGMLSLLSGKGFVCYHRDP